MSSSPIVAALTPTGTALDAVIGKIDVEHAALSLVAALATVRDPRRSRGIRHSVLAVVVLGACAVLAGARSFVAIAEYAHDVGRTVLTLLGLGPVVPHESTIRRVLQQLDPAAVETALQAWALAQLAGRRVEPGTPAREQRRVWALDGKTVRGTHVELPDGSNEQVHLVSVLDQASGAVLAQVQVSAKAGELTAVPDLLSGLDLDQVLVTADALHTQHGHADYLHERGGHYLMTVKANQPRLLARLRALPWSAIGVAARERGRGHGRLETRAISVVSLHPCPDAGGEFFPHAAQAIKLVRRRRPLRPGGRWSTVTVYAITSLSGIQADPALLARWIRGHWSIENRLHWVRDVTFDEDRSQVRTSHGPQIMASYATWPSPPYGWPAPPTSPPPCATTAATSPAS